MSESGAFQATELQFSSSSAFEDPPSNPEKDAETNGINSDPIFPRVKCDYCGNNVKTYRYKCLECEDYDLCCTCFERRKCNKKHKISHIVVRFSEPDSLYGIKMEEENLNLNYFKETFKKEVHTNHNCKECKNHEITGLRLKCDTCFDYNLCFSCSNQHVENHPTHPLISHGKTLSFEIKWEDVVVEKGSHLGLGVTKAKYNGNIYACKIITAYIEKSECKSSDSENKNKLKSVLREQEAYREIKGENVHKMIGYCSSVGKVKSEETFYILTEIMEKGSLQKVQEKEPHLSYSRRFGIAADIAAGLARIHMLNFAHRDLHPGNILIGTNYNAKIADMGLARLMEIKKGEVGFTRGVGAQEYRPPEVETGNYKKQVDIYSFGLLLNRIFGGTHDEKGKITKRASVVWELVSPCINADPDLRPTAQMISETFYRLRKFISEQETEIFIEKVKEILDEEKMNMEEFRKENENTDPLSIMLECMKNIPNMLDLLNEEPGNEAEMGRKMKLLDEALNKSITQIHKIIAESMNSAIVDLKKLIDKQENENSIKKAKELVLGDLREIIKITQLLVENDKKAKELIDKHGLSNNELGTDRDRSIAGLIEKISLHLKKLIDEVEKNSDDFSMNTRESHENQFKEKLRLAKMKYDNREQRIQNKSFETKLEYFAKTLRSEEIVYKNNAFYEVIDALLLMGDVYYEKNDPVKALEYYEKALDSAKNLETQDDCMTADCLESIANIFFYLKKDTREALKNHLEAFKLRERFFSKQNEKDVHLIMMASSLASIADCYFEQGQIEEASKSYEKAFKIQREYYGNDKYCIDTLEGLRNCYWSKKNETEYVLCDKTRSDIRNYAYSYQEKKENLINSKYADKIYQKYELKRMAVSGRHDKIFKLTPSTNSAGDFQAEKISNKSEACSLSEDKPYWEYDLNISITSNIPSEHDLPDFCPNEDDPIFKFIFNKFKSSYEFFNRKSNIYSIKYLKDLFYYCFYELKDKSGCETYSSALLKLCKELFQEENNMFASDALMCRGNYLKFNRQFQEALNYADKTVKMREELLKNTKSISPKLAFSYELMGEIFEQLDSKENSALECYSKSLEINTEYYEEENKMLIYSLDNVAKCYSKVNKDELALETRKKALKLKKDAFKLKNPEREYFDVFLVRGKDGGRPAWHYILLDETKYLEFIKKKPGTNIDVADYGKIIKSGFGEDPGADIRKEITKEYDWE